MRTGPARPRGLGPQVPCRLVQPTLPQVQQCSSVPTQAHAVGLMSVLGQLVILWRPALLQLPSWTLSVLQQLTHLAASAQGQAHSWEVHDTIVAALRQLLWLRMFGQLGSRQATVLRWTRHLTPSIFWELPTQRIFLMLMSTWRQVISQPMKATATKQMTVPT
jgi:hypothetical protein